MPKKTTTVIPPSSGRSRPYAEYPEISTSERCVMHIDQGFAPNMRVPGVCFVSPTMRESLVGDLRKHTGSGPFTVSLRQVANVAGLPGIVKHSVGLPDMHTGYGFSIGNICAVDMDDPTAVVSPGGIGFDINCGVRMLRTNLHINDIDQEKREELAQAIFDHVPVGVGSQGMLPTNQTVLRDALEHGMDWSIREGYSWAEDKEHCEELGRMLTADPSAVSTRAMQRGLPQLGTLGAGNHFIEVQAVEKIYDTRAARRMGVEEEGQIVVMIHSGSRGFGHQVATDALVVMEQHMAQEKIAVNDPQLACARIGSDTGKAYLASMACAANFAWVNRSAMTFLARQAFAKVFKESPDDLDMQVIYDVSHNIAKREQHMVDGKMKDLLLHRKGATRALPPWHPLVPVDYQCCGQPVLLGGSMGTSSYILLGTDEAMDRSFGSTCHGAGRTSSRTFQRRQTDHRDVIDQMTSQNIAMRVASPNLLMEECADAYKNVDDVVDVCAEVGISRKCVKMKPIAVIKG